MMIGGALIGAVLFGLLIIAARVWKQPMYASPRQAAQMGACLCAAYTWVGLSNYFEAIRTPSSGFLFLPSFLCAAGGFAAFLLLGHFLVNLIRLRKAR